MLADHKYDIVLVFTSSGQNIWNDEKAASWFARRFYSVTQALYMPRCFMRDIREVWAKRPSGMVLEVCTEWRNPKLFQSYPTVPATQNILKPMPEYDRKQLVHSRESSACKILCEWSEKLGPGAAWGIKLFFTLLGTLEIDGGEEVSEVSIYSVLVTHWSFITGKTYFIIHKKDAIHLELHGCTTFAKLYRG